MLKENLYTECGSNVGDVRLRTVGTQRGAKPRLEGCLEAEQDRRRTGVMGQ
jgi:hypothetical protein